MEQTRIKEIVFLCLLLLQDLTRISRTHLYHHGFPMVHELTKEFSFRWLLPDADMVVS